MKKWRKGLILLLACLLLAGTALADVIWEPEDNYYTAHSDEFTHDGHTYFVNGAEGYAVLYDKPGGTAREGFENGTRFYSEWQIETGGETWGYVEQNGANGKQIAGYFKMREMICVYDSAAFIEEFEDVLQETAEEVPEVPAGAIAWAYPHSGGGYAMDFIETENQPSFSLFYTDDEGLLWGYCAYYYGDRDFWICLSDPMNADLSVRQIEYEGVVEAAPVPDKLPDAKGQEVPWLAIGLVTAVVLVTAIILVRVKKTKKRD